MPIDTTVLFWCATVFAGLAFGGFAWMFVSAVNEGAGNYANQMGEKTSRQFEELFLFVSPKKIAELGRLAALAAFFLFFIPLFSFTNVISTVSGVVLGLLAGAFTFTLPAASDGITDAESNLIEQILRK